MEDKAPMPIIVTYLNPNMRPDIIEGESWFRLDTDSRGRGMKI